MGRHALEKQMAVLARGVLGCPSFRRVDIRAWDTKPLEPHANEVCVKVTFTSGAEFYLIVNRIHDRREEQRTRQLIQIQTDRETG